MGAAGWQEDYAQWVADRDAADAADQDFRRDPPTFEPSETASEALPLTTRYYISFAEVAQPDRRDSLADDEPWPLVYTALYEDLISNPNAGSAFSGEASGLLEEAAAAVQQFEALDFKAAFLESEDGWADPEKIHERLFSDIGRFAENTGWNSGAA